MPMTDLVRFLNARNVSPYAGKELENPFVATDKGVAIHFAKLQLRSQFQPIVDTSSGRIHGHSAALRVTGSSGQVLDPESVFVLPANDDEFVYLDRLVRTLHALNYLTNSIRGNLLLGVHLRHVLSVPADHGLAFEGLLRQCGLAPEQVTLEIDADGIEERGRFLNAIANYKARGYGIALSRFGHSEIDFGIVREIAPDIVKLDRMLLASMRPLKRLIGRLQEGGTKVLIEAIDTAAMRKGAASMGIDLVQSHGLFRREPEGTIASISASERWIRPASSMEAQGSWAVAANA